VTSPLPSPLPAAALVALRRRRGGAPAAAPRGGGVPGVGFIPEAPDARLSLEVAWGADLSANPDTWSWTDETANVRTEEGISTRLGRNDESSETNPAEMSLTLDNLSGDYSTLGRSRRWPYVRRNTPVRLRIDPGTGPRVVLFGFATGWTPAWDSLTGRIPVVRLTVSGTLRRLGQGAEPVISPIRRYLKSDSFVTAYWPCEVSKYATSIPAEFGGGDMTWSGTANLASCTDYTASLALPTTNASALFRGAVYPYTAPATRAQSVRMMFTLPTIANQPANNAVLVSIIPTGGTVTRMDLVYGTGGSLTFKAYDRNGTAVVTDGPTAFGINGSPGMLSLEFQQSGATLFLAIKFLGIGSSGYGFDAGASGTATVGTVSEVWIDPYQTVTGIGFGHVAVLTAGTADDDLNTAISRINGYDGEGITGSSSGRLNRITSENAISMAFYSSYPDVSFTFADLAGPQPIDTVVNILRECEKLERGVLWDGVSAGLAYTTRRRHEDATPAITINAAAGELCSPFSPADDDQRTRNRWTVNRSGGAEFTVEDTTGPMGTAAIGIYPDSMTVVAYKDRGARDLADWLVHQGTTRGLRYPTLAIDLRAVPRLVTAVTDLFVGARVDVIGLSTALLTGTPGTVSLTVEGIAHSIGPDHWLVTLNCSPYEVWKVATLAIDLGDADEHNYRPDAGPNDSTVATLAPVGSTSLSVATVANGVLWTTTADDFPMWLDVGGEPVRATACSGASSPQSFTVDALAVARPPGTAVTVWNPPALGL
jgi:hypothetical protein